VGDVAAVSYAEPEKRYALRVNSRPAVGIQVLKEGDANTLEVSRAIGAAVERMQRDPRLARMEIALLFDQGDAILESLGTLLDSGKIGGLLAVAVLFFFLRRLRMTLIITLSIPLSLLIALAVMFFAGETLNVLSLLGLMICIGLLVDNSVVVAENVFRLHKAGLGRREAAIRGAGEIALAITTATLTTVIVFLPVSLVESQGQFFLLRMAIPVCVSLLASLVVALVFVPLSVYLTLPAAGNGGPPGVVRRVHLRLNAVLHRAYDWSFGLVNRGYARLLGYFLRRRFDLVLALLAVLAATGVAMKAAELELVDQNEDDRPGFEIEVEAPPSYSFEQTSQLFGDIEAMLAEHKEELGLEGYFFFHRAQGGDVEGWMYNPPRTELRPRQVAERVMELLPERAGVRYYTGNEGDAPEKDEATHTLTLTGEDPDQLERIATELEEVLTGVDGVVGVKRFGEQQSNELELVIDRDRAQRQGVNPQVVAGVVGYALRGQALPEIYAGGREIQVRVRFEEADRESLAELADFAVPTADGGAVPLSTLTDVRFAEAATTIRRLDKRIARTITLDLEQGREDETRERLGALTGRIDLPEGVAFGEPFRGDQDGEDNAAMIFAMGLSVVFIYLLMGFLFESFILPLSIVLTIPLAGIGVIWTHVLTGRDVDGLGMVGGVLLIGVVVNNGIVLIDYVNRLRGEGHASVEAIVLAAERRFRPIMMTALTTIFGLVPLTVGPTSSIGVSYKSFGYTLIGGLTTATLFTLLVVPIFYTLFDDMREALVGALARGWRRRAGEPVAPLPAHAPSAR
jgi:HAE1 family hydrophobic/amphiphilic exporter-1